MSLFQRGEFTSAAGLRLAWKIDCDCLSDEDLETIAEVSVKELPRFDCVIGVPTGGYRIASRFRKYMSIPEPGENLPTLYVDDVLTTGKSISEYASIIGYEWIGFVIFSRGKLPPHIKCFMQLSQ